MEPASFEFFQKLLNTPSPSGYERPIQDVVRAYVRDFADEVRTDLHGNVIACINPCNAFTSEEGSASNTVTVPTM